jgi:GT2 family glycosyltransferase
MTLPAPEDAEVNGAATRPTVAVVLVNWNDAEATIACLDSVIAAGGPRVRCYVVDNASSDGSPARVRAAHPAAIPVAAPTNLGYAGGFNLGWQRALADGFDYLWLLNNDTTVAVDCLDRLLDADRQVGPALLSPKILYAARPDRVWYAGGRFDRRLKSYHIGQDEPDGGQYDDIREIEWATGCSLFCAAAVARRLGPMDERYFLYLEDADWCLRARRLGVPIYLAPAARVFHAVSQSVNQLPSPAVRYYAWRNYYLLAHRHGSWSQRLGAYGDLASRFLKIAVRQVFFPACRRDAGYQARTRGLIDFVRGRFGPAPLLAADVAERRPTREVVRS